MSRALCAHLTATSRLPPTFPEETDRNNQDHMPNMHKVLPSWYGFSNVLFTNSFKFICKQHILIQSKKRGVRHYAESSQATGQNWAEFGPVAF